MTALRRQLISFGSVGMLNTLVDTAAYATLIAMGMPVVAATILSTGLGLMCSFALNGRFTFGPEDTGGRRRLLRFLSVTLAGLWILQPAVIWLLIHSFGLQGVAELTIAKLFATGITMVWNFWLYRRYVFAANCPNA